MITLSGMSGIAPKVTTELAPDNIAQVSNNVVLHKGGVAALKNPVTVATPTKSGTALTLYKFGRNQPESQYWFKFTTACNVVRGPIAGDTEEKTYWTGDGVPKKTNFSKAIGSGTDYPVAYFNLKVPAPTTAATLTEIAGTGPTVREERAYVYTNVTEWGEESGPSPACIGYADATHIARLTGFEAVPTGSYSITARYIYRTVTSTSGTNYYYVGQITASGTQFDDSIDVASIGEPLPSLDWDEPPDDLFGLVALPSGALCAISGKDICFSVIGAPYAWPQKYRLTCDFNPVAVAPMGQGVVVLTDGFPYFINTGDPESAQMVRMDEEQPCVSARSVVAFGGGVIYASPSGLISITQSGTTILTDKQYSRDEWQALTPSAIHAYKHDGRFYGFFTTGGFILDKGGNFYTHDVTATAGYVDPILDQLYIAVGSNVQRWDSGTALTHRWKSKRFNLPKPMTFTCAKIKANSFTNLTFKLYIDGALAFTKTVTSAKPFRLPPKLKSLYEFEVTGTDHWTVCAIGANMEELKNV